MKWKYEYGDSDVLINKFNITDFDTLLAVERAITLSRNMQLLSMGVTGKFDSKHMASIHGYLFQDLYDWAGEFRDCYLSKNGHSFVSPKNIKPCLKFVEKSLKKCNYLTSGSKEDAIDVLTVTLANVNAVPPFREGNGRTQRVFLTQLAANGGYDLSFEHVSSSAMKRASIDACNKDFAGLRYIIKDNLVVMNKSYTKSAMAVELESSMQHAQELLDSLGIDSELFKD